MASDALISPVIDDDNPHPKTGNSLVPDLLERLEVPELRKLLELRREVCTTYALHGARRLIAVKGMEQREP